jgi:hypothetical protein
MRNVLVLFLAVGVSLSVRADDKKKDYQVGIFMGSELVPDGTFTNNISCPDGTTCTGSAGFNGVRVYSIRTDDGLYRLETLDEANDSGMRKLGMTPQHLFKEKTNLLDALKIGDKVAIRVKIYKGLFGITYNVYVPGADNPKKEDRFLARFISNNPPPKPVKPTDNIKALCDAGKLFGADCEKPVTP